MRPPSVIKLGIPGWRFYAKRDPSFRYLEEHHEYRLRGGRLWSPSMVFEHVRYSNYSVLHQSQREAALYRGTYVHWATRLSDEGELDWADVPGEYVGYLEAYEDFKCTWRFRPRLIEMPIYHPILSYGVTPDREGIILDGDAAIVELKTGTMPWWTAIQTASQELAIASWDRTEQIRRRRIGVELSENGKFRAKEFSDPEDYETWRSNIKTCQRLGEPPFKLAQVIGN